MWSAGMLEFCDSEISFAARARCARRVLGSDRNSLINKKVKKIPLTPPFYERGNKIWEEWEIWELCEL